MMIILDRAIDQRSYCTEAGSLQAGSLLILILADPLQRYAAAF